jgi:hypothetical protein
VWFEKNKVKSIIKRELRKVEVIKWYLVGAKVRNICVLIIKSVF